MNTYQCVICDGNVESSYHWLAEQFPNLCHLHKDEVHKRRQNAFRQHLAEASAIVNSWSEWERNILTNDKSVVR
jgi:hypothetical protein